MKIETLINNSGIPETLIRATVAQSGGWDAFTDHAPDVAGHGAAGGFSGFIHYSETCPFACQNMPAIRALLKSQAEDMGIGILEMVAGFRCLSGDYTVEEIGEAIFSPSDDSEEAILNALAWYALEEVSRAYVDQTEQG